MTRLQTELHRLYLQPTDAPAPTLIDAIGQVRAMVIELAQPPSWVLLARIWHGVQAELELPAPAIAVSGIDGIQLWFSLAEPVAAAQAQAFLEGLRSRFLPEVAPARIRLMPALAASALRHAGLVPARQETTGQWSAFVAPDLAPVFADTPWLDIPPNEEGQAALLRGLVTMKPAVFEAALAVLRPSAGRSPATSASANPGMPTSPPIGDPKHFLLQVMNDDTVALALRIEAAKALLQHSSQ